MGTRDNCRVEAKQASQAPCERSLKGEGQPGVRSNCRLTLHSSGTHQNDLFIDDPIFRSPFHASPNVKPPPMKDAFLCGIAVATGAFGVIVTSVLYAISPV